MRELSRYRHAASLRIEGWSLAFRLAVHRLMESFRETNRDRHPTAWGWRDVLLVLMLATVVGTSTYVRSQAMDFKMWDVWFEGNLPRNYAIMARQDSDHSRTNVHPLFSLISYSPTFLARHLLGVDRQTAVRLVLAATAALWLGTFYLLLRRLGCHRLDAGLFSLLAASSAAAMFWLPVPETYAFGSLSLLLALLVMVLTTRHECAFWWDVVINVLTLSVTVTNWMAGLLATVTRHPWDRGLRITLSALGVVTILAGVQSFFFPSAGAFFTHVRHESKYLLTDQAGGPLRVTRSLVFHSIVMPRFDVVPNNQSWKETGETKIYLGERMTIQYSRTGSGSVWGRIAVSVWGGLLILGLWSLAFLKTHGRLRVVLGLLLLGQVTLHVFYGEESFLYALHVVPLLILLAALSTLTLARPVTLALTVVLILTATLNNGIEFQKAVDVVTRLQAGAETLANPLSPTHKGKLTDLSSVMVERSSRTRRGGKSRTSLNGLAD